MTTQPKSRVSAGVREGGQFATEHKSESGVTLGADAPRQTVDRTRTDFAQALGVSADSVSLTVTPVSGCGTVEGEQLVNLVASTDGGSQVKAAFLMQPSGTTRELTVSESWPSQSDDIDAEESALAFDPRRSVETHDVAELVAQVRRQARVQRALDEHLNYPADHVRDSVRTTAAIDEQGELTLQAQGASWRGTHTMRLRLGSSGIEHVEVDTWWGVARVQGADADKLLESLEDKYAWGLSESNHGAPSRAALEARLARVLGQA